ncbi:GMP/IMP nucleotidase [Corallincola spongiicola]|uniref:GMP/IMP nucleotidase n=1 Tax=Corallincola spongiicola TaxID=2520508 RepID=A0ABY1WQ07_9GAMM|nr:GMP/IMP nucleotidase [Corallincola spongiicola]TAA46079.1 GMP/IMP nucleotidase [Corallincola spongiicola]
MLNWKEIDTVLLDMDGTLLDLHFDNHFWLEHLPKRYAEEKGLSQAEASSTLLNAYHEVRGSLQWYCLDYWQARLQMDIVAMKREVANRISLRPDTLPFLAALKETGRAVILLTNAHPDSLSLKVEKTQLDQHLDLLLSSHNFGAAKEEQKMWQALQKKIGFDRATTLFIDDSVSVLNAARKYGIAHLLAVANPDSQKQPALIPNYQNIKDYRQLLSAIRATPR